MTQATQVEKLQLKNQALKVLEKKLEQQLQHKRDAAKAEYEVRSVKEKPQVVESRLSKTGELRQDPVNGCLGLFLLTQR